MKYVAYTDYSRTIDLHNGHVETIWHCGKCMTIKPGRGLDCPYCRQKSEKTRARIEKLLNS